MSEDNRVVNGVIVGPAPRHVFKPKAPNSDFCECGVARVVHVGWTTEDREGDE